MIRTLPKPNFTAEEVFTTCISRVRNRNLKSRLEGCIQEIIDDSDDFEIKAETAGLHLFPKKDKVNGDVTKDEMEKVYTSRMVPKDSPGRSYYERLRYPTNDDKCPFCSQRPASTLDHYLAKTDYPSLAVTPTNLVPACKDCNFIKLTAFPTRSEEETLHPYFDNIDNDQWLFARVLQTSPVTLSYFIKPPANATSLLAERVKYHFKLYELNILYKSEAITELSDITYQMNNLLKKSGPNEVKKHLAEIAESCYHNRRNSWKTAMYQALAEDEWYCTTGAGY